MQTRARRRTVLPMPMPMSMTMSALMSVLMYQTEADALEGGYP
jgi:hypothetical protein